MSSTDPRHTHRLADAPPLDAPRWGSAAARPSEPRLDAVFGDPAAQASTRAELATDPQLGPEYAELAALETRLARSLGELRLQISPPQRVVAQWTATCRAMLPSPERSSRRRAPLRTPRAGTLAAMVLLAGMIGLVTLAIMPRIDGWTRRQRALTTLHTLQLAILAYQDDYDEYPPSGNDSLVRYLDGDPANGGPARVYHPFFASELSPTLEYLDPWGRPYQYRTGTSATHNARRFDLWSDGPNERRAEEMLANWMQDVMESPPPRD